jgi:hypothetical protein
MDISEVISEKSKNSDKSSNIKNNKITERKSNIEPPYIYNDEEIDPDKITEYTIDEDNVKKVYEKSIQKSKKSDILSDKSDILSKKSNKNETFDILSKKSNKNEKFDILSKKSNKTYDLLSKKSNKTRLSELLSKKSNKTRLSNISDKKSNKRLSEIVIEKSEISNNIISKYKKSRNESISSYKSEKLSEINSENIDPEVKKKILVIEIEKIAEMMNIEVDFDLNKKSIKSLEELKKTMNKKRYAVVNNHKIDKNLMFYRLGLMMLNASTYFAGKKLFEIDMGPYMQNQIKSVDAYLEYIKEMFDEDEVEEIMGDLHPIIKIIILHSATTGAYIGVTKMAGTTFGSLAQGAILDVRNQNSDNGIMNIFSNFSNFFQSDTTQKEDIIEQEPEQSTRKRPRTKIDI